MPERGRQAATRFSQCGADYMPTSWCVDNASHLFDFEYVALDGRGSLEGRLLACVYASKQASNALHSAVDIDPATPGACLLPSEPDGAAATDRCRNTAGGILSRARECDRYTRQDVRRVRNRPQFDRVRAAPLW